MTNDEPSKSLSERLWERQNALEQGGSGRNRIEFLKLRDEIRAALEEGWSGRMVWELLHNEGQIRFGHTAFAKYVRTLIHGKPALGTPRSTTWPRAAAQPAARGIAPKPKGFVHTPFPRKDDLL